MLHIFDYIFIIGSFQQILQNEDCEELDAGSGSVHSAGNPTHNQHQQRTGNFSTAQNTSVTGQKYASGMRVAGNEKITPPNSLNLSSSISKNTNLIPPQNRISFLHILMLSL